MTEADLAERLTKRRATVLFIVAVAFTITQSRFIGNAAGPPDVFAIGVWLAVAIIMLAGFATGGGWARSRGLRALLNDESTRTHRARAATIAFYNMMATGVVVYGLAMIKPVSGQDAAHLIMTVGIASALIGFSALERGAFASGSR